MTPHFARFLLIGLSLTPLQSALAEPALKPEASPSMTQHAQRIKPTDEQSAEEIARDVVERWTVAQNQGDAARYAELFAEGFIGIRRVGQERIKLKRAAWLKERARMFRKSPKIVVTEVQVDIKSPNRVEASFTQRWSSTLYEDLGPKRLLIDTASRLILEEEMISSTVVKNLYAVARELGARGKARKIRCEVVPGRDDLHVCVLDEGSGRRRAEYTAALLRKTSEGYTSLSEVYGRAEVDAAKHEVNASASTNWGLKQIGPQRYAAVITVSASSEGGWGPDVDDAGGNESSESSAWYAIEDEALRNIHEVNAGGSSDLTYSGEFTEITVTPTAQLVGGYFTLKQVTTVTAWGDDLEASADDPKVTSTEQTLIWDTEKRVYRSR